MKKAIGILLAGALLVLAGCSAGGEDEEAAPAEARGGESEAVLAVEAAPAAEEPALGDLAVAPVPGLGPKIVQTATIALVVERDRLEEAVERARTIAVGVGGFVASSTSSRARLGTRRGAPSSCGSPPAATRT